MPIYAECDICGKKYRFADEQAGQSVPCKECTAEFEVIRPPMLDRRVLIGVGAAVGLFVVGIIGVEIVSALRGPTPVAVSPPQNSFNPRNPALPVSPPSASTPQLPRLPTPAPPNVSPNVSFNPSIVAPQSASPSPASVGSPLYGAATIRSFEPLETTSNAPLTIKGEALGTVHMLLGYQVVDPTIQLRGLKKSGDESQATMQLISTKPSPRPVAERFVILVRGFHSSTVGIPKPLLEVRAGQLPPPEYRTMVYVPEKAVRKVGPGAQIVFVDTDARVELDGTAGVVFLRAGAQIVSVKNLGQLEIVADYFKHPENFPAGQVILQLGHKLSFCVVDDLPRISN